jgi:hypothetical protein
VARDSEPNAPLTAVIGIVGAVLLFVVIVLLQAFFYHEDRAEQRRKAEAAPADQLALVRAEQQEVLSGYRWIDRRSGVVGIPVERAMRLLLERGESAVIGSPAATASSSKEGANTVARSSGR